MRKNYTHEDFSLFCFNKGPKLKQRVAKLMKKNVSDMNRFELKLLHSKIKKIKKNTIKSQRRFDTMLAHQHKRIIDK